MKIIVTIALGAGLVSQACAADLILYPVQTGTETIRYRTGIPTLNIEKTMGAVTVTPLPLDHNHATFGMAVYNKGTASVNFGDENITASVNGHAIPVLTREELQRRAKSRAAWSAVGIALLSGVAAAAASTAHTTSHSYGNIRTPRGTYFWSSSYRDNTIGAIGAGAAVGAGTAGIIGIQNRLEYTLGTLATDILQTTTIDPDNSYGGEVVIEKPDGVRLPYDVTVTAHFNGEDYPFTFRMTEQGKNKPPAFTDASIGQRPAETPLSKAAQPTGQAMPAPAQAPSAGNLPPPAASSS
jgi:hypothetical protein